jgi:hypothetical protein
VPDSWDAAWRAALDELELSLDRAELLLRHAEPEPLPPWQPPSLIGSPPPDQLERAHRILERQLRVTRELGHAMTLTRQQLTLTTRMGHNRPQETSLYIDVTA